MEAQLSAGWLLTLKAAWLMDQRRPNTVEASACKRATQVAVVESGQGNSLRAQLRLFSTSTPRLLAFISRRAASIALSMSCITTMIDRPVTAGCVCQSQ